MKLLFGFLFCTLLLAACEFNQDPVSGASDAVRNGQPPVEEPPQKPVKPVPKDLLAIDAPDTVSTRAGFPIKFKIAGRVLGADIPFEIMIGNMDRFEGAVFDPTTGEFSWTPAKVVVEGTDFYQAQLIVKLSTFPTEKYPIVQSETRNVNIIVHNSYDAPIIKSFSGPSELEFGRFYFLEYTVEHMDSLTADEISVVPYNCSTAYQKSLSHVLEFDSFKADPEKPGLFKGRLWLDLSETPGMGRGSYCVGIVAYSQQGKRSNISTKSLSIEAAIRHTVNSTNEDVTVVGKDEVNTVHFTIEDPSGIGTVKMIEKDDIAAKLPGSTLNCSAEAWNRFRLTCVAKIVTTATSPPGRVNVKMVVENSHPYITGRVFSDTHFLRIEVK